ncbi:MAG TPA: DUF2723 domain-containing protein [Saprospiraceae bacterium]|nr:DUF2723 domain-containing protein [Saprospiraceae bacterium]
MSTFKRTSRIAGWIVFAIAFIVYFFSVERTGSLWDCGEFLTGADKLEVVHPPGAPLFMIVGRMFALLGHMLSDDPSYVAFMVNLSSGMFTAFAAMFVALTTMLFGKLSLVGREGELNAGQNMAVAGAGIVAGLVTAFAPSIWFSAVEGEVYAMSTFFTTMTFWAAVKWYALSNDPENDRWLIFSLVSAGMSLGVHLLSLLVFPAIALLYFFKKYPNGSIWKAGVAMVVGVLLILAMQTFIVTGIPNLWKFFEVPLVNSGLPRHSGLIAATIVIGGLLGAGLWFSRKLGHPNIHNLLFAFTLVAISYSVYGVIVVRANAAPPINMNNPSDALRLLPYLNREQYGERSLLKGPLFDAKPYDSEEEDRLGWNGKKYVVMDKKLSYKYRESDKVTFPRMYDANEPRPTLYKMWTGNQGKPTMKDNIGFFWDYQMFWMYGRYFMWNFVGRQNGAQGFYAWDASDGNWISGINAIDNAHLGFDQSEITPKMKNDKSRNTYYFLPFLFGLIGMVFHLIRRPKDFAALMLLFLITGVGLVVYANEPPNEPRERDYVFIGSFFAYAMWVGMGVLAIFQGLTQKMSMKGIAPAGIATALVLSAPILMGTQNFDDMGRKDITAARDYAHNFLESCAKDAIVFTYGDNDTYPLWYAQEIEGIRTDVRVINLSLIAVDWYIDLVRRKVNDSPRIKMTIPKKAYQGYYRNMLYLAPLVREGDGPIMPATAALKFAGESHPLRKQKGEPAVSYFPTKNVFIPVNKDEVIAKGVVGIEDTSKIVPRLDLKLTGAYLLKDQLAVLDIIASNLWERPIYFAVTCREEKVAWYKDYLQLEGLASRIVPIKSPSQRGPGGNGGVTYMGRVAPEIVLENVKKFWWGNFDKKELFVDHSYGAAIQSQREVILRAAQDFVAKGKKDKAIELLDLYFKGFPDMNFEYDYNTMRMLNVYLQADGYEKAKPYFKILEKNVVDNMKFFSSIDQKVVQSSFRNDLAMSQAIMSNMISMTRQVGDDAYSKELQEKFAPYLPQQPNGLQKQKPGAIQK